MIDIDHFKAVNDNYGHPVGDVVLKLVATKIQQCVRNKDILARYGGEEFVVILSDCSLDDAKNWAERVRGVISKSPLTVGKLKLTLPSALVLQKQHLPMTLLTTWSIKRIAHFIMPKTPAEIR
jgi:FOG: GGDEF domain